MAEIEKKYSDYQTSECETQESVEPIDERLCPTCQPNPDWKLPAPHWSDIAEAYLNESVCEYHVRVYESEAKQLNNTAQASETDIRMLAVERILVDLDKPLNDGTTQQLLNASFIIDDYRNIESRELGVAFLVGVPSFNMDQIESNDSPTAQESTREQGKGGEFIVNTNGLGRKLFQLRSAISVYGLYYARLNKLDGGFVIRKESDETQRINYDDVKSKIQQFQGELNDRLKAKGYAKIGKSGLLTANRARRIKFTFKDSGKPYDLKTIHVLDSNCDKYIKIPVKKGSVLRKPSMRVVYSFLENLDRVINDITAKETKPWLEFTLEHFYPNYIVDYGSVASIDDTRAGLECLLELELGIGSGKVIDSLTAEILSAFDIIEEQMAKQACRSLTELSEDGATALSDRGGNLGKGPKAERDDATKSRYQKEFENKALNQMVDVVNEFIEDSLMGMDPKATREDVFDRMKQYGLNSITVEVPWYYNKKEVITPRTISNEEDLVDHKRAYANERFFALENGNVGAQIQNSPHYHEALEAFDEVINNFDNTYIAPVKKAINGRSEIDLIDLIPTIGLCGMSKIAGKAMECIANGVSFDDFLDILIDKTFDFMEVNTLSLFLNGLPAEFREELNTAIEVNFGSGVDISSLIGIKLAEGGNEKLKDFVKSKQVSKRVLELFEKYESPIEQGSDEERRFLVSVLGSNTFGLNPYSQIQFEMSTHYSRQTGTYIDGPITRKIDDREREYKKREKFVLRFIKSKVRDYRRSQNSFLQATDRVRAALRSTIGDVTNSIRAISSERRTVLQNISEFEALIDAEKSVIDEIVSSSFFNEDGTIASFTTQSRRQEQLLLIREITGRISDYRIAISDLEEELDGFVRNRSREELIQLKSRVDFLLDEAAQNATQNVAEALREVENFYQKSKQGISSAIQAIEGAADRSIITANEITNTPEGELNPFEQAAKSFEETALGVKVDAVFDVIFDFAIESILDYFSADTLFERLRSYPAVDFAIDKIEELLLSSCPNAPIFYPPPNDFMKSFSLDVCDPTVSMSFPKLIVPNLNFRFKIEYQFNEIFRETIVKLASDISINLLKRLMSTLESSLCNLVESAGGIVAEGLRGNLKDSFYRSLNEAFCNDGENPETSRSKAEELAEALFAPFYFDVEGDYTGAGARVSNVISSVATTEEFLTAMVAREGEEDDQFNKRISNAISTLTPEMEVLLGDPNQVAYFFRSLGSFLPTEDRKRIRDILDAGVPNLPISQAICLTNDQLDEWNRLREDLLDGDADRVKKLNDATIEALEGVMDDVANLDSDGPFIGSATNEALKDVCNPNNVFNDVSQSEVDRTYENELIDGFFENISKSLVGGFMNRGGLLAEAMRDVEDRREFGRNLQKLFRLNYGNSQQEQDSKFNSAGRVTRFIMNLGDDENADGTPDVVGRYPDTVGIKQRKEILEDDGISFNFSDSKSGAASARNIVYRYSDSQDNFSFMQEVSVSNLRRPKKVFGYNVQVIEDIEDEGPQVEINFNTPVEINESENEFMESVGFQYKSNEKQDIRKEAFGRILLAKTGLNKNFDDVYEDLFKESSRNLVESLLTNDDNDDNLPVGYKYGYVSDDLTRASFEYTPSENEGELGSFASPRIIPLDPKLYGGRYSNPPYYVEPRKFTGWLELATSAFESQEGCDPRTPPLISFSDISDRTKNLSSTLRNDPRLSKTPECVSVKPFHLLLGNKSKAKLDGVVRTTIRTYLSEFFIKGYGLFSNMQIRPENFDSSMMSYIVSKMKSEMQDLGTRNFNRKIRIVRERYWYTFLEQSVEAYQRTIDVDNVQAPESAMLALNRIQLGLDKYKVVDRDMKKRARKLADETPLTRPVPNFDSLEEVEKGNVYNLLMSVAFKLTPEGDRELFFDGGEETSVKGRQIRFASLKKLQFFQKIYFIKLFEREATLIMEELIKDELSRLSQLVIDGPTDKPYYFDLYKSFFGMKSFFPQSTSRVGLNSYYLDKQTGTADTGEIPTVVSNNIAPPIESSDKTQLVVESYVRLIEKRGAEPNPFSNREVKYRGAVSLSDMSDFVDNNLDFLEGKYLSDFFGDLSFTYSSSFSSLMGKGFDNEQDVLSLIELNRDIEDVIRNAYKSHLVGRTYSDFDVTHGENLLTEGEEKTPTGTMGSTGVKYGLRVCAVLPKDFLSPSEVSEAKATIDGLSRLEKAYLFDNGAFMVPLASSEIDLVDAKFEDFDPFSGTERYDLECLINKIVENPEFTAMFDKLLNFRQASSMLSIYCMETLPASIGRDESERTEVNGNPDVDDWDRTVNKSGKNFLRREFRSLYLSNTEEGLSPDNDDDESLGNLIQLNNPFDFLSLPTVRLPWWKKRRMRTKIYDANGQECASPEKDLQ